MSVDTKLCSVCRKQVLTSLYSATQLKLNGKRICKECIANRNKAEEIKVALKQCTICNKTIASDKEFTCSKCSFSYCGSTTCKKSHLISGHCRILQSSPFQEQHQISEYDINVNLAFFVETTQELLFKYKAPVPEWIADIHLFKSCVKTIQSLYPLVPTKPWWNAKDGDTYIRAFNFVGQWLQSIAIYMIEIEKSQMERQLPKIIESNHSQYRECSVHEGKSIYDHPSKFISKLLHHWIYFYRHVDQEYLQLEMKNVIDVNSDNYGLLPFVVLSNSDVRGISYVRYEAHEKASYLVPIYCDWSHNIPCLNGMNHAEGSMNRAVIIRNGKIEKDCGIYINRTKQILDYFEASIFAYTGAMKNVNMSFLLSRYQCMKWTTEGANKFASEYNLPRPQAKDSFDLTYELKQQLKDDWPKEGSAAFVPVPNTDIESDLVELLVLEELNQLKSTYTNVQLLLNYIEEEANLPVQAILEQTEAEIMELWIHEQNQEHLRITHTSAKENVNQVKKVEQVQSPVSSSRDNELKGLKQHGAMKFKHILKIVKNVIVSGRLKLQPVEEKQSGSHRVIHFSNAAPFTVVQKHSGKKSKDNSVSKVTRLNLVKKILSIATSALHQQ